MAISPEKARAAKELREQFIKEIISRPIADYIRTAELGSKTDFSEAEESLKAVVRLFEKLNQVELEQIPAVQLNRIREHAEQIRKTLQQIIDYNPVSADNNLRRNLIGNVDRVLTEAAAAIAPYLYLSQDDLASEEKIKLSRELMEVRNNKDEAVARLQEVDAVLNKARSLAAESGIEEYSKFFDSEAQHNVSASRAWLGVTCLLS